MRWRLLTFLWWRNRLCMENGKILNLENFLHARYTDECHFDALGHALIGKGLSVEILNLLDISHRK